jgi:hypothetical protein
MLSLHRIARALLPLVVLGCGQRRSNRNIPTPSPEAICIAVAYDSLEAPSTFPTLIALDPPERGDSGRAFWMPPQKASRVWQMFYAGGSWHRYSSDSVEYRFSNGFTVVVMRARSDSANVQGRATWLSDVVGNDFSAPFTGHQLSCADALRAA